MLAYWSTPWYPDTNEYRKFGEPRRARFWWRSGAPPGRPADVEWLHPKLHKS